MSGLPRSTPGERVGPFVIERYLASGGMGDVYVAHHHETGEAAAIKLLARDTDAALQRFQREGRIAGRLDHPNIVRTLGFGTTPDARCWLGMELLVGEDLDARIRGPGLSPADAVDLAMQVCAALDSAHRAGIVHRDLKPQNIFLVSRPHGGFTAKVLDFGIAHLLDGHRITQTSMLEQRVTKTGVIIGTLSYVSPEQARGERDLDHRSDIWSLGVVLYQCLTGQLPFEAPSGPGTLYKILFETPRDVARARPGLPEPLADVVRRCLSKARDGRPASADAMRSALAAVDLRALGATFRASRPPPAAPIDTDAVTQLPQERASGIGATVVAPSTATDLEVRLTSVVYLNRVEDSTLAQRAARELLGRVITLAGDDVLVVFGMDRWNGDEPQRAVRLALATAAVAARIGVATGRALQGGESVAGAAVDDAVRLSRQREHGITLDAETARAVRRDHQLELRDDGSAFLDPGGPVRAAPAPGDAFDTPFVGRELELSLLMRAVQTASASREASGVVVVGPAGMGKSRLRHEAMVALDQSGMDVVYLWAGCEAFRRDTPFAALREALAAVADPTLVRSMVEPAKDADPVAFLDRVRTWLASALHGLSERGTIVLAVDDAQWLDPTSRAAIRWVCDHAGDLPLALWIFSRPEGRAQAAELVSGATVLELGLLARPAAVKILEALAGTAPTQVIERAGGHPLFLEELGRMYKTRGEASVTQTLPLSIEGAHLAQLDQLDPLDREFLKRAAVFGRTAWVEAVVAVGGDAEAATRLRHSNLLAPRARPRFAGTQEIVFRSSALQEVTYGLWPEPQLARLHEQAADWLRGRTGVAPEELARHLELAGLREQAAEGYVAAAEATAYAGDADATRGFAERALKLSDRIDLRWRALVARDAAMQLAGDPQVVAANLTDLRAVAEKLGLAERTEAAWRLCYAARMKGDHESARREGQLALELATQLDQPRWGAAVHYELGLMDADEGRHAEASRHAGAGAELAKASGDPWMLARARGVEAYVLLESGRPHDALALLERGAADYQRAGDLRREAVTLANLGDAMLSLGRLAEAREVLERAVAGSRKVGNERTVAVATVNLAVLQRLAGELDAAAVALSRADAVAERLGFRRLATAIATERIFLALQRQETPATLVRLAADAEMRAEASPTPGLAASARAAALRARHAAGTPTAEAVNVLRDTWPPLGGHESARVETAVALAAATGDSADVALARELCAGVGAGALDPEDRAAHLDAFARRYLVPPALITAGSRSS